MADLTQAEEAKKYRQSVDKQKRQRLIQKVQMLRAVEAGTLGIVSFGTGALEAWKPEVKTALSGFAQPAVITTAVGGVGYMLVKDGMGREALGGTFLAGFGDLMKQAGGWVYKKIAG